MASLTTQARAAGSDDRATIIGRQKIRQELSDAMTNGHLSRRDQYRILLDAKEVLNPEDLVGLERTLDRLASAEEPVASPKKLATEGAPMTGAGALAASESLDSAPKILAEEKESPPGGTIPRIEPFNDEMPGDACQPPSDEDEDCPYRMGFFSRRRCNCQDCVPCARPINLELFSTVDAFKGPLDFPTFSSGNFGVGMGVNAGMAVAQRLGLGFQVGSRVILADLAGTGFGTAKIRTQDFTSLGLFQRVPRCDGSVAFGFTYDFLFDNYYAGLRFGQWRVKFAWEASPWNEVGVWAAIREHGDATTVQETDYTFRPLNQGNVYWRHTWYNDANVTARVGIADNPNSIILGTEGRIPISSRLAVLGNFAYMPSRSAGGLVGQAQEIWNVSLGLEYIPGGLRRGRAAQFAPLLPVADNGTFAVRDVSFP